MAGRPKHDDRYSDEETARRRDEVVKRMLSTPPTPRQATPRADKGEPGTTPAARPPRAKPRP